MSRRNRPRSVAMSRVSPSRRSAFRPWRRSPASAWPRAPRTSPTGAGTTCCWPSWPRAPSSPGCSPGRAAPAPRRLCRRAVKAGRARALVVNAGNANAFTGRDGAAAVMRTVQAAAESLGCRPSSVLVASTGVIGEALQERRSRPCCPVSRPGCRHRLGGRRPGDHDHRHLSQGGEPHGGPAWPDGHGERLHQGAGMIAPDMATTLGFVFTDAAIGRDALQAALSAAIETTYNCLTVEGDTSTSDTVLVFATGAARNRRITDPRDPALRPFRKAWRRCWGPGPPDRPRRRGVSKFVTVTVTGAAAAGRRGASASASPTRPWSRPPSTAPTPTGAASSWPWARRASGRTGTARHRPRRDRRAAGGAAVPGYDEAPVVRHMKGDEIDSPSTWASAGGGRRCGPAT